jgi:AbrB family looped-hinge helix DNA binding protein
MRVSIDKTGRVVIPVGVRERLGLRAGQELELDDHDGSIRLSLPARPMRVDGSGKDARIVTDDPMPVLTDAMVRSAVEAGRDRR